MIDTEPNVIDNIKSSSISKIFDNDYLISGKEDAANNFARGYRLGKEIRDTISDKMRQLFEKCDNAQG